MKSLHRGNMVLVLSTMLLVAVACGNIGGPQKQTTALPKANASTASGAIILAWNKELLHIVQTPKAQPATIHPTRSFTLLHTAIYDAIVSITRDATPFLITLTAPSSALPEVAAAQAGHDTLVALYPKMKAALDQQLTNELAAFPDGTSKQQGIQVGQDAASRIIAIRSGDGSATTPTVFVTGTQPGNFRPTPPAKVAPVFTNWGNVLPFVLNNASQFRPEPPPALTSSAYALALNEVKSLGQNKSAARTADQTQIAKFWSGPIWNTWNEIAENAATAHHTNLVMTARLFAILNISFADSAIAFYEAKYHYQLWRPITAIRLANTTGNTATVGDPTWTPLVSTATDPSYPGAHSVESATGAAILSAFFGNQDQIQVTSDVLHGTVRSFTRYSDIAMEAGLSRIYAGLHTRLDHEAGLKLGQSVAQFILPHFNVKAVDTGN